MSWLEDLPSFSSDELVEIVVPLHSRKPFMESKVRRNKGRFADKPGTGLGGGLGSGAAAGPKPRLDASKTKAAPAPRAATKAPAKGKAAAKPSKREKGAEGSREKPIDVGSDVNKAADLLAQGKHVQMDQARSVSTLLTKLAEVVKDAKAQGDDAPNFDLCKVTVPGTNLFCADEETEILTEDGWRRYDEVAAGDTVLTLNHETGLSEWQLATAVSVFPVESRTMLAMEGQRHSSLTTMDHRWPVVRVNNDARLIRLSADLAWYDAIPTSVPCATLPEEETYSDEIVRLVAWAWTEGSFDGSSLRIYQSQTANPAHCQAIRDALEEEFGEAVENLGAIREAKVATRGGGVREATRAWREWTNVTTGQTTFYLNKHAAGPVAEALDGPEKVVRPEFLRSLTRDQLGIFIETSIDADGCRSNVVGIGQRSEARIRSFEMACALAGISTTTRERQKGGADFYDTTLLLSTRFAPRDVAAQNGLFTMRPVEHKGLVWCPTTPNGTWLARRRGTVYYTGNCAESKGIPRVQMPQLSGKPLAGSKADGLPKDEKGEVNLTALFRESLEKGGTKITDEEQKASYLRASQIELNGAKVAGMASVLDAGKTLGGDPRIFVSHDDYIVDGHHRWAANVAHDATDGTLGDVRMPVARVDMDIIELLDYANRFAEEFGIPQAAVGQMQTGEKKK